MNNHESKENFSIILNNLWRDGKFTEAKDLLIKEVSKYPTEYYLWTSLAQTCSGLCEYKLALEYSIRAINLCKNDVLVLYNHIGALIDNGFYKEALPYCQQILKKSVKNISHNGEGVKWAKSIINDTLFLKAISLFNIGEYKKTQIVLKRLLSKRRRGIYSDFSKKQISRLIKKTEQNITIKNKSLSNKQ